MTGAILVINAGSSSLKFAIYSSVGETCLARGEVGHIGDAAEFCVVGTGAAQERRKVDATSVRAALGVVLGWMDQSFCDLRIDACGHRIVHGGERHRAPIVLDDRTLDELETLDPLAPQHQPFNLAAARELRTRHPDALAVACFDTAFHADWPDRARRIPIPRRFHDGGIRRYGFHGLSYEYLGQRVAELNPHAQRVVLAHLGSGASICAVRDGRSVDCTMGFSALDGLPMATRCGAIDAAVIFHLQRHFGLGFDEIERTLFNDSGLKGMSGLGADVRRLLADARPQARQAIAVFVYRCMQAIGAMAATLGGVDAIAFSGGIGAHAPAVRAGICEPLGFLGCELDPAANQHDRELISTQSSRLPVYALVTDEETVIARHTRRLLNANADGGAT